MKRVLTYHYLSCCQSVSHLVSLRCFYSVGKCGALLYRSSVPASGAADLLCIPGASLNYLLMVESCIDYTVPIYHLQMTVMQGRPLFVITLCMDTHFIECQSSSWLRNWKSAYRFISRHRRSTATWRCTPRKRWTNVFWQPSPSWRSSTLAQVSIYPRKLKALHTYFLIVMIAKTHKKGRLLFFLLGIESCASVPCFVLWILLVKMVLPSEL